MPGNSPWEMFFWGVLWKSPALSLVQEVCKARHKGSTGTGEIQPLAPGR